MRKYSVMGCLGLALALMVGQAFAQSDLIKVEYEDVSYSQLVVDLGDAMVSASPEIVVSREVRMCSQHDYAVASNFRASSAGMVFATLGGERYTRSGTIAYTG